MKPFDRTLLAVTMSLTQASRTYIAAANKVAGNFGLSHATAWPLLMISRIGDGIRPGMIADALGLDPASLVRVVDQLVETGLITRDDDPHDRRAKLLTLTREGTSRAAALEAALLPFRRDLFDGISPEDIAACLHTLQRIKTNIAHSQAGEVA